MHGERRIDQRESAFGGDQARDSAGLARNKPRMNAPVWWHDQIAGDVARAPEVFFQRVPHDGLDQQPVRRPCKGQGSGHSARETSGLTAGAFCAAMRSASTSVIMVRSPISSV